ncbi:MAG: SUMF1/EgtB/PvdO family nonheme iron enzyme, partial [Gammaproteobacteria bacterium]|nr:SUMF1/EgtB/PvdO family nonheme iron enzyme [Gammaproteobacteria bacterium]
HHINPIGPKNGGQRVLRGGSWFNYAWWARSACRSGRYPGERGNGQGFRFAATGSSRVSTVRQSSIRAAASERGVPD